jgi:predicted translin family RNA/ssDNA-binding protein
MSTPATNSSATGTTGSGPQTSTDPLTAVDHIFNSFQEQIEADQTVRESIRESTKVLDRFSKQLQSQLQRIHRHQNVNDFGSLCAESRQFLQTQVNPLWQEVEIKVPKGDYFKYNDIWRFLAQRFAGSCALIYYLETEELGNHQTIAEMIGLKMSPEEASVYLDLEDYLHGLLQMANELSRFTINCVINRDYSRPVRIGQFMSDLNNGFRELNLKNDFLRKKYDGLKYDIKKVEEVIYDISIRGLATPVAADGAAAEPQSSTPNANSA